MVELGRRIQKLVSLPAKMQLKAAAVRVFCHSETGECGAADTFTSVLECHRPTSLHLPIPDGSFLIQLLPSFFSVSHL